MKDATNEIDDEIQILKVLDPVHHLNAYFESDLTMTLADENHPESMKILRALWTA